MQKIFSWGGGKIIEVELPGFEDWVPELFEQFHKTRATAKKSHKIGGRWENLYIDIDEVPAARNPIRMGRDFGLEILKVSSVVLFEPLPGCDHAYPPFWFNLAEPGESTGLHDHTRNSKLCGVFYLAAENESGNLFFHKEGEVDLEIMPKVGKLVLFEPWMRHGVRENRSNNTRLSMAFNLFPFPLPVENL